jgi:3-phosphoshikimate 1-carboxyvinyltransferase
MLDPYPILPFTQSASASLRLPGSKSITNRALVLAAMCEGETLLEGALFSQDTEIMVDSLRRLGFSVEADPTAETIRIQGQGGRIPNQTADLFVGNAGTAARFLTALCAASPKGVYHLDGVPQMRTRPMAGLLDALTSLGAEIESDGGHFPIRIQASGLAGGDVAVEAGASSQMLSALLMVAPLARRDCRFQIGSVRIPFVQMTLQMMEQFGQPRPSAPLQSSTRELSIAAASPDRRPPDGSYRIEADVTAASYFATLPLVVGGEITIENFSHTGHSLQGDAAYFEVLQTLGGSLNSDGRHGTRFTRSAPPPATPLAFDFSGFSDTFLTLAAISPLLRAPLRIHGIAHTRKQETDRVSAMANELGKLGQTVEESEDALAIQPRRDHLGSEDLHGIDTYHDHRFAMSFALLGLHDLRGDGRPWLAIRNPQCCAKTFPGFFQVLAGVHQRSHSPTQR